MKRIIMTLTQVQAMIAKEDGYNTRKEWLADAETIGYWNPNSINCLVEVENMGFCKDGLTKWYSFEDAEGRPCIYFKH